MSSSAWTGDKVEVEANQETKDKGTLEIGQEVAVVLFCQWWHNVGL